MSAINHSKRILTVYFFALSVLVSCCARIFAGEPPTHQRVVSLAPSVTETLFALGFGSIVSSASRLTCDYPAEALEIAKNRRLYQSRVWKRSSIKGPDLVIGVSSSSRPGKVTRNRKSRHQSSFDFTSELGRHLEFY